MFLGLGAPLRAVTVLDNTFDEATPGLSILRRDLTPSPKDLDGYMGHDDYEVMENTFVRRFPVYKKGDTNASPSGGFRQFQYKLKPGGAAWQMKIDRVESY